MPLSTPEQAAALTLFVNPIVCPNCKARYPKGTKICSICKKEIPEQKVW